MLSLVLEPTLIGKQTYRKTLQTYWVTPEMRPPKLLKVLIIFGKTYHVHSTGPMVLLGDPKSCLHPACRKDTP